MGVIIKNDLQRIAIYAEQHRLRYWQKGL